MQMIYQLLHLIKIIVIYNQLIFKNNYLIFKNILICYVKKIIIQILFYLKHMYKKNYKNMKINKIFNEYIYIYILYIFIIIYLFFII